eukprot:TRINITY_DN15199_c0_g1_i1.p1 TRINITY_DN15199_c0_g1~~TRINITY_DN15199_c0_g1_i1.p1  ORF type:complete len:527 (-),score=103.35 TRINITY_DN15199_c0_g1_i1:54-1634(-)
MFKPSTIFVVLLICFLSVCSSLILEDMEEMHYYESSQNGFWPMPGANIENNGYSDMALLDFASSYPKQLLTNDEGITRSPPVMDRNGFVYTVQKTNDTQKGIHMCSIECYDPAHNDEFIWSKELIGYHHDDPCDQALIAFDSLSTFFALVDGHLFHFTLYENHTVPDPVLPYMMPYNSSLFIPLTDNYFIVDDTTTHFLHIVYYYTEYNNCSSNSSSFNNSSTNCTGTTVYVDRVTNLRTDANHSPAAHFTNATAAATGLQDAPLLTLYTWDDDTLYAVGVVLNQIRWTSTIPAPQQFMSNVVVASAPQSPLYIFVLVVTNSDQSEIVLNGYDENGELKIQQKLYGPVGGEERAAGRLSVDLVHHTVVAMFEAAPGNNTVVVAYDYLANATRSRDLNEPNFQGPVSIDYEGKYYVVTSQYSGYLVLNSTDLSTVDRVLDTSKGLIDGITRNYAALGNGTLVVTGSNGVVGFGPEEEHHSSGGNNHRTVIILLCVFGGLVAIVLILALAGLAYHYYNRNKRQGYEQI